MSVGYHAQTGDSLQPIRRITPETTAGLHIISEPSSYGLSGLPIETRLSTSCQMILQICWYSARSMVFWRPVQLWKIDRDTWFWHLEGQGSRVDAGGWLHGVPYEELVRRPRETL